MATSNAVAVWRKASSKTGRQLQSQSGHPLVQLRHALRGKKGANPGRAAAAAHGRCFRHGALRPGLEKLGIPRSAFETRAAVTLETVDGRAKVTRSVLEVRGKVPAFDDAAFRQAAETAKKNCPLSKVMQGNVEISMDAKLA